ncbi:MAG: metallophosphoesterase family protein [Pseudomonadota bacterium]
MLRLFGSKKPRRFEAPIQTATRAYAIGDIHGRLDLLTDLVDEIREDSRRYDGTPELVFLGDYIDRGEDSSAVLDFLMQIAEEDAFSPVFLLGNHERMMLDFLMLPELGSRWLRYGGLQTLMSYGTPTHGSINEAGALEKIQVDLADALGPHRAFLEACKHSHMNGNVLFVHAAANPNRPADAQSEDALLWGHPRFFEDPRQDGVWVVHGHTVVEEPGADQGRISIDTGAYYSNRLTAVRLDGGEAVFLSA